MPGYIHFTIVLSISFLIFYVTRVDWPLDSVTQQSFIADTVLAKTSERLWCHHVLTVVSTTKIFHKKISTTICSNRVSKTSVKRRRCGLSDQFLNPWLLLGGFIRCAAAEKWRLDFRPKLVRLFLGLVLTYLLSEQLKCSLQHILSNKKLRNKKEKKTPLLVPLWWWASVRRPYKRIIYVHFICSKGQIQRTMMKTGGDSPVCYFLLCFAVNAPLNLLLCTCAIDKMIECFFSHFFSPCTPALPTCNVPWFHLTLFCLEGEMSSEFGGILQCIK